MVEMILHGWQGLILGLPLLGHGISQLVTTWGHGHGCLASAGITAQGPSCRIYDRRGDKKILKHGSSFLTEPKFLGFRMAKTLKISKFVKNGPKKKKLTMEWVSFLPKRPFKRCTIWFSGGHGSWGQVFFFFFAAKDSKVFFFFYSEGWRFFFLFF